MEKLKSSSLGIQAAETVMELESVVAHEVSDLDGKHALVVDNRGEVNLSLNDVVRKSDEVNLSLDEVVRKSDEVNLSLDEVVRKSDEVNDAEVDLSLDDVVRKSDEVKVSLGDVARKSDYNRVDARVSTNLVRDDKEKEKTQVSQIQGDGFNMMNLFVDLSPCRVPYVELKAENGTEVITDVGDREEEFKVGDLVWGKVRSHPWWPGQIFDPSDSSNKAMKYFKKGRFLVAYFGDQSFAFNEPSHIKPFRMCFAQMVKQSNVESFSHAVDFALDEVSRRVEFGLACSCIAKEEYSKIESQFVVNAGIRKQSSRIDGGDRFSTIDSFKPDRLVRFLKNLAGDPFHGTDGLEFLTAKAQVLAFNRWNGNNQHSAHQILDHLSKTDEKCSGEAIKGANTKIQDKKRKSVYGDVIVASKKEKRVSDLMAESYSMKKGFLYFSGSRVNKVNSPPKKLTKLGERIRRVVRQLSKSPRKKSGENRIEVQSRVSFGNPSDARVIMADYPPVDEMLTQLHMAAVDPMDGQHSSLISIARFFTDFRKRVSMETNGNTCNEATETSGFEGIKDSYWTDRIIQPNPGKQVLFDPIQENSVVNLEYEAEKKPKDDFSPTALVFNFSELNPNISETYLNDIFGQYGPLNEMETEVMKKSNRAKVVFKRRRDAETAFSSPGKFSIFGPSLRSYRLHSSPTPRKKASTPIKRKRKDADGNSNPNVGGGLKIDRALF